MSSELHGLQGSVTADVEIPILDVGPFLRGERGALPRLAKEVRYALESIGFFFIRNHGVSQDLIDRVFVKSARFHELPLERKMAVVVNESLSGFLPTGIQQIKSFEGMQDNKPDLVEAFFMARESGTNSDGPEGLFSPRGNQWPEGLPGFRETLIEYFDTLEALCERLLPVYASALDLSTDFFDEAFLDGKARCAQRLSRYPSIALEENQYNTAPHCDGSFITLLAQSKVPGLQIRSQSGKWFKAPALDDCFLVNSGELLRLWSNDRFLSTTHRVINASGGDRYAIPFFYFPSPDTLIECMETCKGPDNPPRYEPITVGEYSEWFASKNLRHYGPRGHPSRGVSGPGRLHRP